MSQLPPNPFKNLPGAPIVNANPGPQAYNHNQQFGQLPLSQLPPGFGGIKQDANSNSPVPAPGSQNNVVHQVKNNYNQSASSSPAFNHPGMMPPPPTSLQSSPLRPMTQAVSPNQNPLLPPNPPMSSANPRNVNAIPNQFPPNFQQRQINDNAPPLIPSSQYNQPTMNGPSMAAPPGSQPSVYPPMSRPPVSSSFGSVAFNTNPGPQGPLAGPPMSMPPAPMTTQPNLSISGPPRNSPLPAPPSMGPPLLTANAPPGTRQAGPPLGPPSTSGPPIGPLNSSAFPVGPNISGPPMGPPTSSGLSVGPPNLSRQPLAPPNTVTGGIMSPPISSGPPKGISQPPLLGPPRALGVNEPGQPGPPSGPPLNQPLRNQPFGMQGPSGVNPGLPPAQPYPGMQNGQPMPGQLNNTHMGYNQGPPSGLQPMPPKGPMPPVSAPAGLPSGPTGLPLGNMQGRYPQMPPSSYANLQQQMAPLPGMGNYPPQPNAQGLTHQMGQLSVTKQGFDQLWGHQIVDLMQCRQILPEYPENPPEIRLANQFAEAPNCSPDIFRCTINKIPDTNNLLQKSRLPLGILIHPFKDLNHLPVIQCAAIVRCRACRTYINPFVYFVDAKRWKCNLCYRVNDLPEEFQYDPVSKSYGDPSRRPEIKSATIEFIAPGEYMLRPPQPAVYLFLLDVSQIARDSGYLQVACACISDNLEQLPGDARTQVGFICYDAHVHYYLMSDDLTRPKEMTVLDIDDVFLPSPESLLVNLGERRSLVRSLLGALPERFAGGGAPASALGAALQAAYKLMAPTGGRITVFQTCLPNVGPGALQSREDPNSRSSKEVAHLNPATDFYKRLALDCSGAQIAVDLFLLNSQYCDLATLSGMSKFSAGTVYHIPLFRAARPWQAEQLTRMLTRYLTRKIGFEAVMRVRCTRGISIHTFHGNFFVRSTDLLSLPNVSPDAGFAMQLSVEEPLSDLQQVCFQAALLYTSSKGERRIRVHTLALPVATNLTDVLHSADQQCIIGLLAKMAVDRCSSASMGEAREALMNVAVDLLSAHRLAQNLPAAAPGLPAPAAARLLPLLLLALLKRKAFRTGTSTRLDDRVADMCWLKTAPLSALLRAAYPHLYPLTALPAPPRLHLSAERINSTGAYLLDDGETMIIYVGHQVSPAYLSETFGVAAFSQLADEARTLPEIETDGNEDLHAFIDKLNEERPYPSSILVLRDNSPNRTLFTERLVDDRVESAFSYYEFLQHIKTQVK